MGVYIKGMSVPKSCSECKFFHIENFQKWCCITDREDIFLDAIPDWCPLIEVKVPHGDLIDKDQLVLPSEDIGSILTVGYATAVIKAEGAEE